MLYVYIGDGMQRIELSTAVGVSGRDATQGMLSFVDANGGVVARMRDQEITAFSKVDLGPTLQRSSANPAFSGTNGTSPMAPSWNSHGSAETNQLAADIEAMNVPVPVAAFAGELESTPMPE
jgi:hypothetical protein